MPIKPAQPVINTFISILTKQITAENLVRHVSNIVGDTVDHNHIGLLLELLLIIHYSGVVELSFFERRLLHDYFHALGFKGTSKNRKTA